MLPGECLDLINIQLSDVPSDMSVNSTLPFIEV